MLGVFNIGRVGGFNIRAKGLFHRCHLMCPRHMEMRDYALFVGSLKSDQQRRAEIVVPYMFWFRGWGVLGLGGLGFGGFRV